MARRRRGRALRPAAFASAQKAGVYDEIVRARPDRQAALGAPFEVYRSALTVSEPIGAVLESLLGDGLAVALAELKAG